MGLYVFRIVPFCFDYCNFVIHSEIRKCEASSFGFFPQDCFGYSGYFEISLVWVSFFFFYFYKNCHCDFDRHVLLNLQMSLGNMEILNLQSINPGSLSIDLYL
jgi:hypothetical protein